jgi:hypothetical protein
LDAGVGAACVSEVAATLSAVAEADESAVVVVVSAVFAFGAGCSITGASAVTSAAMSALAAEASGEIWTAALVDIAARAPTVSASTPASFSEPAEAAASEPVAAADAPEAIIVSARPEVAAAARLRRATGVTDVTGRASLR